jgi:arylsulfatase A
MLSSKPNLIFILADDLGWAEPGCYGHGLNETPHLDALASNGIRFTHAYASSTVCSPSRAGILTGQTPPRNGITDYLRPDTDWYLPLKQPLSGFADNELPEDTDFHLRPDLVTLPQMFKQRGYTTGMVGKWHLSGYDGNGVKHGPENYGFDEVMLSEQRSIASGSYFPPYDRVDPNIEPVLGENEYLTDRLNHEAVEFIKRHPEEPFFLYLSHYAVHTALAAKKEDIAYFAEKAGMADRPEEELAWVSENNPVLAAMLKSVDDGIGDIVQTLDELGLRDNTLLVFTSDNGGETRVTTNGHLREGKSTTYEGGLRIPLIVSYPGLSEPGRVTDVPTINLDFYSTFADLIGYEIPEEHITDGASLIPVFEGTPDTSHLSNRLFSWHYPLEAPHFLGGRSSAANRKQAHKYIRFLDDGSEELYRLDVDESESTNLAEHFPEVLHQHRTWLRTWLTEVKGVVPEGQCGPEDASDPPSFPIPECVS